MIADGFHNESAPRMEYVDKIQSGFLVGIKPDMEIAIGRPVYGHDAPFHHSTGFEHAKTLGRVHVLPEIGVALNGR